MEIYSDKMGKKMDSAITGNFEQKLDSHVGMMDMLDSALYDKVYRLYGNFKQKLDMPGR